MIILQSLNLRILKLSTLLYSYTHTHIINNSCDVHTTGGQLLQFVDIVIIGCFSYHTFLLLQYITNSNHDNSNDVHVDNYGVRTSSISFTMAKLKTFNHHGWQGEAFNHNIRSVTMKQFHSIILSFLTYVQ